MILALLVTGMKNVTFGNHFLICYGLVSCDLTFIMHSIGKPTVSARHAALRVDVNKKVCPLLLH